MIETKYYREGCVIKSAAEKEDGNPEEVIAHGSISKAKKKSRMMQMQNGGLGRGYLQTIVKEPKRLSRDELTNIFRRG